jgi:amino acid adenylation domain-containing protein
MQADHARAPLLPPEQARVRARCHHPSGAFVPFPREAVGRSILDRFEAVARAHPDRPAVRTPAHALTYRELDGRASAIARAILRRTGPAPEPVALLLEHDAAAIAALLGALRAGRPYVPLDPRHPPARLRYILEDSGSRLVLASAQTGPLAADLAGGALPVVDLDALDAGSADAPPPARLGASAFAVLIYTSGSTGRPKGVPQTHGNILHDVMHYTNAARFCREDRMVLLSSLSFADSLRTVYGSLLNGAALCPYDVARDGLTGLAAWLEGEAITVYRSVPTLFRHLVATLPPEPRFPALRLIFLAGEPVVRTDVDAYRRHFSPGCIFVNRLGTTEALTYACNFLDHQTPIAGAAVPVGYAVPDKEILLLDAEPEGNGTTRVGEIAVRSRYLSPGYWRRPDLTGETFLPDPEGSDLRVYRSGDLGRLLPDGGLVHLGRKDFQVKVRGHRIEPGEIEVALAEHPAVRDAVVVARDGQDGDVRLTAYVAAGGGQHPTVSELRRFLRDRLPGPMIPAAFVVLEALPLTPTGKVDRRALPDPGQARPAVAAAFVAPATPIEQLVARIWAEVLGLDRVGAHDDFLELGGDSLLAARVLARIADALGLDPPRAPLLAAGTVAEMARVLVDHAATGADRAPGNDPRPRPPGAAGLAGASPPAP